MDDTLTLVIVAAAVAVMVLPLVRNMLASVQRIMPAELKDRLDRGDDLLLVDVRTPGEFSGELGSIAGSVNIPLNELGRRMDELKAKKDAEVIVVCRSGARAVMAARKMEKAGLRRVAVLKGGMVLWNGVKLPVVRGSAA